MEMLLQETIKNNDNGNKSKDLYKDKDWLLRKVDKEGLSWQAIGKLCNVNENEIYKYYLGFKTWGKDEMEECWELYKQGYSYKEIPEMLNKKYGNYRTIGAVSARVCILRQRKGVGEYYKKNKERKEKMSIDKPENFKNCYELLEKIKSNPNVNLEVVKKMESKARNFDEAVTLDYSKMAQKHMEMLKDFSGEIKQILEDAHKPIRKVWYFASKGRPENVKQIEKDVYKWIEQEKTKFPKAKITLSQCKNNGQERIIRNNLGQFEVLKTQVSQ